MNKPPEYWPGQIVGQASGLHWKLVILECRLGLEGKWKYRCLYAVTDQPANKAVDFNEEDLKPIPPTETQKQWMREAFGPDSEPPVPRGTAETVRGSSCHVSQEFPPA